MGGVRVILLIYLFIGIECCFLGLGYDVIEFIRFYLRIVLGEMELRI